MAHSHAKGQSTGLRLHVHTSCAVQILVGFQVPSGSLLKIMQDAVHLPYMHAPIGDCQAACLLAMKESWRLCLETVPSKTSDAHQVARVERGWRPLSGIPTASGMIEQLDWLHSLPMFCAAACWSLQRDCLRTYVQSKCHIKTIWNFPGGPEISESTRKI